MTNGDRFTGIHVLAERAGVVTEAARDLRTGLVVRLYRFRGRARGAVRQLEHPNLPGVLDVLSDDATGETRIVTALPRRYAPLGAPAAEPRAVDWPLHDTAVRGMVSALALAHANGATHGDLGAHRIWRGDDGHVLLEGFGAPWRPDDHDPSPAGDVRALAAALHALAPGLPDDSRTVLAQAALGRGEAAGDGGALLAALHEALPPEPVSDDEDGVGGRKTPPAAASEGASQRSTPFDTASGGTLIKDLPPGGVYREGERAPGYKPGAFGRAAPGVGPDSTRRSRLVLLAVAALLLGLTVAGVALVGLPRLGGEDDDAPASTSYVVDVRVAPAGAPPMEIEVRDAPSGSDLAAGTRLGRAPRRVVLDHEGRYLLVGAFGQRRSDAVPVQVPGTTSVTLFLEPSGAEPGRMP